MRRRLSELPTAPPCVVGGGDISRGTTSGVEVPTVYSARGYSARRATVVGVRAATAAGAAANIIPPRSTPTAPTTIVTAGTAVTGTTPSDEACRPRPATARDPEGDAEEERDDEQGERL